MDHLLIPRDDLQENPLGNADFSSFADGSYLKDDNGKYCAGYAIATPFDVEVACLPLATSAQQAELYALTELVLESSTKLPIFVLIVDMLLEQLMFLEHCESNMAS